MVETATPARLVVVVIVNVVELKIQPIVIYRFRETTKPYNLAKLGDKTVGF